MHVLTSVSLSLSLSRSAESTTEAISLALHSVSHALKTLIFFSGKHIDKRTKNTTVARAIVALYLKNGIGRNGIGNYRFIIFGGATRQVPVLDQFRIYFFYFQLGFFYFEFLNLWIFFRFCILKIEDFKFWTFWTFLVWVFGISNFFNF